MARFLLLYLHLPDVVTVVVLSLVANEIAGLLTLPSPPLELCL